MAAVGAPGAGEWLAALAVRSIFFGHQSVGADVLAGVRELTGELRPALRILETRQPDQLGPGVLAHWRLGENGRPETKLAHFEELMAALAGRVDLALAKLCFADIGPDTDAPALARSYCDCLARLARRHSQTTFLAVTAPLTASGGGLRGLLRGLLRRPGASERANAQREIFNAIVRASGRPLFDLARAEARAGGRPPSLDRRLTDDGGHLNAAGRAAAAAELLRSLAQACPASRPSELPARGESE